MKTGWIKVMLNKLCIVDWGNTNLTKSAYVADGDFLAVSAAGCDGRIGHKEHRKFTPVLSAIGAQCGRMFLPDEDFTAIKNTITLTPRDGICIGKFLYYLLNYVDLPKRGAAQPFISKGDIKAFQVVIPASIAEQQRIVAIIDQAFEAISAARANAEQNRQNARALFESYLQAVFSQRGEGWVEKGFTEVCEISSTLVDPRQEEYLDMLHVGGANIESKTGTLLELKTASKEGLISGKFTFDESMVLYSKIRPYLMKVVRPDFHGLCSADIYPLSPKRGQVVRDYLFYLLLSPAFTDYVNAGSARAGMPKVNRDHLFAYRGFFPPVEKQMELAASLDALLEETQRLESLYQRKIEALDELKQSLLQQVFSGQL